MINPMVLPTGNPKEWKSWMSKHSILGSLEVVDHPISNQHIQIQNIGIDAIYLMNGGLSSKINFLDYLRECNKIRLNNGQNLFQVYIIFILRILKNLKKILK